MTLLSLPEHLFWDTELSSVDLNKNARFIIQRVIERGSIADWKIIKEFYGIELIKLCKKEGKCHKSLLLLNQGNTK